MKKSNSRQYDKVLSPKEINEIEDEELKNIRLKYWKLRHDAFLSDDISENDLDRVIEGIFSEEQKEIENYRRKIGEI